MSDTACIASASLYSGRPDPEWPVDDARVKALERRWHALAPSPTGIRQAPPLGYRGCALRCSSGHVWVAYDGVVTHRQGNGPPEHRIDGGRRFEQALLDTAPPGALPAGMPRP